MGTVRFVVLSFLATMNVWSQGSAYFPPNASSLTRIRVVDSAPNRIDAVPGAYQITGGNITVEAWVFPIELPESALQQVIVRRPSSNGFLNDPFSTYSLHLQNNGVTTKFVFEVTDGVSSSVNPHVRVEDTADVVTDTWYHVAGTYDGSVGKLYVDGQLVATDTFSVSMSAGSTGLYLGGTSGTSFEGLIDEVRLWNVTRSDAEILAAKDTILAGDEAGLAGYWRFDEAAGATIAVDQTSNHNDLNVQNGATFVTGVVGGDPDIPIISKRQFIDLRLSVDFPKFFAGYLLTYFESIAGSPTFSVTNASAGIDAFLSNDSLYISSTPGFTGEDSVIVSADNGTTTTTDTFRVTVQSSPLQLIGYAETQLPRITDVWGYKDSASGKEYALIGGGYNSEGVSFFDVTDPTRPRFVTTLTVDGFDIKSWKQYVYCAGGGSGGSGEVVDMTDPENPLIVGSFPNAHNIWIDERGYLYGEFAAAGSLIICDLNANPLNPPIIWNSSDGGDGHDATVIDTILYDFHGYNKTTNIYGVSNPASPVLLGSITEPSMSYNHSGWPTEDGNFLFVCDELATGNQKDVLIWDISNLSNPTMVGSITDPNTIVHNLYIRGNYAYVSWYNSGLRIYDISTPSMPVLVDQFDTYPLEQQNYNGAFGVYIFAPSKKIYVSDEPRGLFIFEFDSTAAISEDSSLLVPSVTVGVFQNPALPNHAEVVVSSDVALDAIPTVTVTPPGGTPTNITMVEIDSDKRFRGAVSLNVAGNHSISVDAVTFQQVDTTVSRSFNAVLVKSDVGGTVSSPSGRATLKIHPQSLSENAFVIGLEERRDGTDVVQFSSASKVIHSAGIEFQTDVRAVPNPGKLFIFQEVDGVWLRLPTVLIKSQGKLRADAVSLGSFKVVYDEAFAESNTQIHDFDLAQNYPNPFNPTTQVSFDLADDGQVALIVYNMLGQKVRTLVSGFRTAGRYRFQWNGRNDAGAAVASGVYLYRLHAGSFVKTRKMLLVK